MKTPVFSSRFIKDNCEEIRLSQLLTNEGVDDSRMRLTRRHYYEACLCEVAVVHAAVVEDVAGPALLMPMFLHDNHLSYFSMPAAPVFAKRLNERERIEALTTACFMVIDYCVKAGIGLTIERFQTCSQSQRLTDWEVKLLQTGGRKFDTYHGYVALELGEAGILSQIRKSYRSLINWGRREMQMIFVHSGFPDVQLFESFRLFHLQVAGRATRPLDSWSVMFDLIKEGRAILGLGYFDGELVAATYMFCHGGFALYGTGVYDRNRFDKPISHWPLFATLVKAYECGALLCDIGELFPSPVVSNKERNIAFFKKGFTGYVVDESYWRIEADTSKALL